MNRRAEAENRVLAQILGVSPDQFAERVEREMEGELATDRHGLL